MNKIYKVLAYPKIQEASHVIPANCREIMGEYTKPEDAYNRKIELEKSSLWSNIEVLSTVTFNLEVE